MNSSVVGEIFGIGTPEMLVILAVVVLLFGAKKLPELSKSIGQSVKELRHSVGEADSLRREVGPDVAGIASAHPGKGDVR